MERVEGIEKNKILLVTSTTKQRLKTATLAWLASSIATDHKASPRIVRNHGSLHKQPACVK
jgi:hypothetical protein